MIIIFAENQYNKFQSMIENIMPLKKNGQRVVIIDNESRYHFDNLKAIAEKHGVEILRVKKCDIKERISFAFHLFEESNESALLIMPVVSRIQCDKVFDLLSKAHFENEAMKPFMVDLGYNSIVVNNEMLHDFGFDANNFINGNKPYFKTKGKLIWK